MKVLISANACSPERGSEPKVGWDAVLAISQHHECWVLTSTKFKREIEDRLALEPLPNVHFIYHGPDYQWIGHGMTARLQSWLLYHQWQKTVLSEARRLCEEVTFDVVHHVTLTAWRMPPALWQLGIPFVWGPVGGTAEVPPQFLKQLSLVSRCFEVARKFHGALSMRSRSFKRCIRNSSVVVAANDENSKFFHRHYSEANIVTLPVVYFSASRIQELERPTRSEVDAPLRLFAGGTLQGSKGIALAIMALAKLRDRGIDFSYTVAGHGPEIGKLQRLVRQLGLSDRVHITQPFSGSAYISQLHAADVYLMPSFRETTPVTLLEAMLAGCYPVVADASAPGEIVREMGGLAVACSSVQALIDNMAQALAEISQKRSETALEASAIAARVAGKYSLASYVAAIDRTYKLAAVEKQ